MYPDKYTKWVNKIEEWCDFCVHLFFMTIELFVLFVIGITYCSYQGFKYLVNNIKFWWWRR